MRKTICLIGSLTMLLVVGSDVRPAYAAADRVAQATQSPIRIKVSSACIDGDAVFTVENEGRVWPASARFKVLRTVDQRVIKARRTRVKPGEAAEIIVPGAAKSGIEVGLRVESSWAEFSDDTVALIRCVDAG